MLLEISLGESNLVCEILVSLLLGSSSTVVDDSVKVELQLKLSTIYFVVNNSR